MSIRRSASGLLAATIAIAMLWALVSVTSSAFVAPPISERSLRGAEVPRFEQAAMGASLGVALAATPEAAHAANQGYAVLQLGWAVFIIGLGPAVLFWIYFNKPEIL
eukprot:CAMPEP_0115504504 /NCGR_PEP_ID=MMETSP0271-20121206/70051_1 /TAXON_ID=71861 /ORGANISM="Scrippsiella trochoidea, Strain CCMP3099" /LENGTH=106 /DNA_ID=CAMNT_0002933679 /DNA_START=53 /DNA_END=373 /DNA_ORIENTATION=+